MVGEKPSNDIAVSATELGTFFFIVNLISILRRYLP